VNPNDSLTAAFESNRDHLRSVAYRMLGSQSAADDAVQESWLRLNRSDTSDVENLSGWLTTVVSRVCLDVLRSRKSHPEEFVDLEVAERRLSDDERGEPGSDEYLADSVGSALLVVLDSLTPAERVAFVLHDVFAVPFEEIAPIIGRSPVASRQLASRARRRVQSSPTILDEDQNRQRIVVEAFLAAAHRGDFAALLAVLDPNIVMRADEAAVALGSVAELRGAQAVASQFLGRAQGAKTALLDGNVGLMWATRGRPRVAFGFVITDHTVAEINLLAGNDLFGQLDWQILSE
jgi:RNA polymerase sigma-70 factor (ECF subfamily)